MSLGLETHADDVEGCDEEGRQDAAQSRREHLCGEANVGIGWGGLSHYPVVVLPILRGEALLAGLVGHWNSGVKVRCYL